MKTQFKTFNWGENTEVRFQPFTEIPKDIPVTACMVMATVNNEYMVLSSPQRGWGLPGGHSEEGETPQYTAIRELREEAAVEIDKNSLQVVGGWLAKKVRKTAKNSKYPELAYQLLFIADITKINQFSKRFEIYDRIFVPIEEVTRYAGGENFIPIFNYVTKTYKERFTKIRQKDKDSIIIPSDNAKNLNQTQ
ncbi:NUDIX domain-containing protein [Candidatus Dojkabacteria bacterium]|nr:NUDIX domain-containing protein [Candidatus Dojkabacteria bacterium]